MESQTRQTLNATIELRRTGKRRWVVTRGISAANHEGTSVEFHSLKAAKAAFDA